MICFHCKNEYKVSTIYNHLVQECKKNPQISRNQRKEQQKKDNLRAKLFQRKNKEQTAIKGMLRGWRQNQPFKKRDLWIGRILH